MSAIDLLLAENPTSERMHQAALSVLLRETPLLERLMGVRLTKPYVDWEPDAGRFDLAVRGTEQTRVLIELKVDGALPEGQIEGQLAHAEQMPDQSVVYLLLGTAGIIRGPRWPEWRRIVGVRTRPKIYDAGAVRAVLGQLQQEDLHAEIIELARAYERMLAVLELRTRSYEGKSVADFDYYDFLGFFDALRQTAQLGGAQGAQVQHVSNPGGGFVCCAWGGTETPVAGMYLQFEEARLCLKISVDNEPEQRRAARNAALAAALAQAEHFPLLGVVPTRGRLGETMSVVELSKVVLVSNPQDAGLLAQLREAEAFLQTTAEMLRRGSPSI